MPKNHYFYVIHKVIHIIHREMDLHNVVFRRVYFLLKIPILTVNSGYSVGGNALKCKDIRLFWRNCQTEGALWI